MKLLRRKDYPDGKFTLAFVGYGPEDRHAELELTHNWDATSTSSATRYGHVALGRQTTSTRTCEQSEAGGKIVREPGPMKHGTTVIAFVEDPDGYKVELIPAGDVEARVSAPAAAPERYAGSEAPRTVLPVLQHLRGLECSEGPRPRGGHQHCLRVLGAVAKQACSGADSHIHPRMCQQYSQCIPANVACGTQLLECGNVAARVLVSSPGIPLKDGVGLRGHVPCELLDEFLLRVTARFLSGCSGWPSVRSRAGQ